LCKASLFNSSILQSSTLSPHSLIHSLTHSLIHSFTHSLIIYSPHHPAHIPYRFGEAGKGVVSIFFVLEGEGTGIVDALHGFEEGGYVDKTAAYFDGFSFTIATVLILKMAVVYPILVFCGEGDGVFIDADHMDDVDADSNAAVEVLYFFVDVVKARIQFIAGTVVVDRYADI